MIWSQGLSKTLSPWVTQACPWTMSPRNILIVSSKEEKGSYYLTDPVEKTLGDDRELRQTGKWGRSKPSDQSLFAQWLSYCLCLCVCCATSVDPSLRLCVCVCVCVLNLQYHRVCEPLTVSKGRMQFTFLCTCTGAATNKNPCLKIKWLEN